MLALTSPIQTPLHRLPSGPKLATLAALAFALKIGPAWARLLWLLWPLAAILLTWHALTGTPWDGLLATTRMLAAVGAANLVTMTTRLSDMQATFLRLARPLSPLLPPQRLALAFALVLRFVPVMLLRWDTLATAFRARSSRRPGWRLIAPAALSALDDAERVAEALRARGGVG